VEHDIRFRDDHFEVVYSGEATLEGFDSVLHDLTVHESWTAGACILNDYRAVDFTRLKSYSKMEAVAEIIYRYREKLGRIRVADLFSESEMQTYAKLEKTIRSYHGYEFEYYATDDYDRALFWLKRRS
jgi:hypothetical protein